MRITCKKTSIGRISRDNPLPASWGETKFFDQQIERNNAMVLPVSFAIKGFLDFKVLESVLITMVKRHEILRTTYYKSGDQVFRKIGSWKSFSLEIIEIKHIDAEEQPEKIKNIIERDSNIIDLGKQPLFKASLIILSNTDYFLLLTFHHILIDGYSINLFSKELELSYNTLLSGQSISDSPPNFQYSDFAYQQRNLDMNSDFSVEKSYWDKELEKLKTLNLPTSIHKNYGPLFGLIPLRFEGSLIKKMEEVCATEGSILYGGLSAALCVVLAYYSGDNEISTHCPIAMNKRWGTEDVMGFFINMIIITHNIDFSLSFYELLIVVKNNSMDAFKHKNIPIMEFYKSNPNLKKWKSISINLFPFNELCLVGTEPSECALHIPLPEGSHTPGIFQIWNLHIRSWGISGNLYYNAKLFEEEVMRRMVSDYYSVLQKVVEHPNTPLKELSLFKNDHD